MPRIITEQFSTFYDRTTRTQFSPVLDRRSGCFVGLADVDEATAAELTQRPVFRAIDDAEFLAMTTVPRAPEKAAPVTGDPLSDQRVEQPAPNTEHRTPNTAPALTEPPKPPRSR